MGTQRKNAMSGVRVNRAPDGQRFEVVGLPTASPIFRSRAEAEAWLRSHAPEVPASRRMQMRACLCCGGQFRSEGWHNRLCGTCRSRATDALGDPQRPLITRGQKG